MQARLTTIILTSVIGVATAQVPAPAPALARPAVAVGGLVFTSGVTAVDALGNPLSEDVASQTRTVLDRLNATLMAEGSSLRQAASVQVYLADANDYAAMNEAYAESFPADPPTRTTLVGHLPAGALVAMSVVAVANGGMREVLHPTGWVPVPRPYAYAIRTEHLVFLSGLVSRRGRDDQLVAGSIRTQMRTIVDNAQALLRAAGRSLGDIVSARVLLTDDSAFDEMDTEYRRHFATAPPARAVGVAPLMGSNSRIEMTFVAATGDHEVFGPTMSPSLPLSTAVAAGPFVFLSGIVGNDGAVLEGMAAQARKALLHIDSALLAAGLSLGNVVENTIFVRDRWQQDSLDRVYGEFFPSNPPARTVIGARLSAPPTLVQFMAVAAR